MATVKYYFYAAVFFVLGVLGVQAYREGRRDERDEQNREDIDAMRRAKDVRDRLRDDPYFVERAREWVRNETKK